MTGFDYHEKDDIAVFEQGNYDNYEKSVDIANFVVELSEDEKFLGLEVIGASEKLPLTKEELSNIEDVEIKVESDEESKMVSIVLMHEGEKTSLNLPVKGFTRQPAR